MAQERMAYVNGEIVPESQAVISILDTGFVHGDAAFDTTRTFNGNIFKLKEHQDRLFNSLRYLRIDPGFTKEELAEATRQLAAANQPLLEEEGDFWIIQRVTRGVPVDGGFKPTVIIEARSIPFKARAKFFRDGLPVITPSVRRTPAQSLSPRAKAHNYLNHTLGELEVTSRNPDGWTVLLDTNGNIAEGTSSSFFVVKQGVVMTSRELFVLPGISRQTTIDLARELNIEVQETDIDLFDAYTADEAFVTATSLCICPVSSVNGSTIGTGIVPGPVTSRLLEAYSNLVGLDIAGQYLAQLD